MSQSPRHQQLLEELLAELSLEQLDADTQELFLRRLRMNFPALFGYLDSLYGNHEDFLTCLENLLQSLAFGVAKRPQILRQQDIRQQLNPFWYEHQRIVGMAVYVDLFAGNLLTLIEKIPYLQNLGITYLHLMPLYATPKDHNDGGYAVSDYRRVNPELGSVDDLQVLAEALRAAGIKLVLDFVFNHTSDEHPWAQKALAGDPEYQGFYYLLDSEVEVAEYNRTLREVFPEVRRGSFTRQPDLEKWVWTTFNSFQWDLNYGNPKVFVAVVDEMLYLANLGCDVFRLDALAFIWKQKGTMCENLPQVHLLIKAFSLCLRIVAPCVLFKSEAIVHPKEVVQYISTEECPLSYNPLLMATLWESLATRETKLLQASMQASFAIPEHCVWVNYIRCHDDIGWTWDDAVSEVLGIHGGDHRVFLNRFYTGHFQGGFSKGVPFQENPTTGDCRVCGTLTSLAGLEQGLELQQPLLVEHAVRRCILLNAVNLAMPGIPLLYQGDELGVLNDYSYQQDPAKVQDSRWVNRKQLIDQDWQLANTPGTPFYEIASTLKRMISIRKSHVVFGPGETNFLETYNPHAFAFARINENGGRLLVLANFSEHSIVIPATITDILEADQVADLLSGSALDKTEPIRMGPYAVFWWYGR